MKKNKILPAGFTLIEVALVVLIGGIVMTAAATMLNDYLQQSRIAVTQSRMQDIDTAIQAYYNVNHVFPCVANLNDTDDSITFGRSLLDSPPAGTTCASKIVAGTFLATASAAVQAAVTAEGIPAVSPPYNSPNSDFNIDIGAVPTRSLNLPDQEMADGWGDRFVYAVTDYLTLQDVVPTGTAPCTAVAPATTCTYYPSPNQGVISMVDGKWPAPSNALVGSGFNPPLYAQYVIISYGQDRAGGYPISGGVTAPSVPCPATATVREGINCNLPTATFRNTIQNSLQTSGYYFDDYVIYHTNIGVLGIASSPTSQFINMMAMFAVSNPAINGGCPLVAGAAPSPGTGWVPLSLATWSMTVNSAPVTPPGCPAPYVSSGLVTYTAPTAYVCCQYLGP